MSEEQVVRRLGNAVARLRRPARFEFEIEYDGESGMRYVAVIVEPQHGRPRRCTVRVADHDLLSAMATVTMMLEARLHD